MILITKKLFKVKQLSVPKRGDLVSVGGEENFRLLTTALFSHQVLIRIIGSWKENEVAGIVVFSQ